MIGAIAIRLLLMRNRSNIPQQQQDNIGAIILSLRRNEAWHAKEKERQQKRRQQLHILLIAMAMTLILVGLWGVFH